MIRDATTVLKAEVQADPVGMPNLVPNPSGELGAWFWVTPLRFTKVTGESGPCLRLFADTGATEAYTQTNPIRVNAGEYIGARLDTVGGTAGQKIKIRFRFFDANSELIATSTPTGTLDTTPATHYYDAIVAPAGTKFAKLKIDIYDSAGGDVDVPAYYDFNNVMVTTAATTFSSPYAFTQPIDWVDILSPTSNITITRPALAPGVMSVRIIDTTLDPADADALRTGRQFRVRALNDDTTEFEDLAAGYYIIRATVAYDLTKPPDRQAAISLTVTDSLQVLANSVRQNSVGAIDDLPFVLETTGLPFNVNGETGTLIDIPDIPAVLEQATALDQLLLTRDSEQGYAWISKSGIVNAWTDRTTDFYGGVVTIDENVYSKIDVAFDTEECINEVMVVRVYIDPDTGETRETTYGPYRNEAAIDEWKVVRRGTFRVTGLLVGFIDDYASQILTANSVPQRRVKSVTIPITDPTHITTDRALIDLYATVNILNTGKSIDIDQHVTSITHSIQADNERGVKWLMTLGFATPESVSSPAPVAGASGASSNAVPGPPGLTGPPGPPGAGGYFLTPAPADLNATYGDHFESSTLDAKWTREGAYVAGDEQHQMGGGSWMQIDVPRVSGNWYSQPVPAGDFTIRMGYFWSHTGNAMSGPVIVNNSGVGVGGGTYASPEGVFAGHLGNSTPVNFDSSASQFFNARCYVVSASAVYIWLELNKTGSVYKTRYSLNGQTWSRWTPNYTPAAFTPTKIGFAPSMLGTSSTTTPLLFGIDFFDVY